MTSILDERVVSITGNPLQIPGSPVSPVSHSTDWNNATKAGSYVPATATQSNRPFSTGTDYVVEVEVFGTGSTAKIYQRAVRGDDIAHRLKDGAAAWGSWTTRDLGDIGTGTNSGTGGTGNNRGILIAETNAFRKVSASGNEFTTATAGSTTETTPTFTLDDDAPSDHYAASRDTASDPKTLDLRFKPVRRTVHQNGFIVQVLSSSDAVLAEAVLPLDMTGDPGYLRLQDGATRYAAIAFRNTKGTASDVATREGPSLSIIAEFEGADSNFSITQFFRIRVYEWVDSVADAASSAVTTDTTLSGDGTMGSPLGVNRVDAAKVTSGTLAEARIPSLPFTKMTGTIADSQIPASITRDTEIAGFRTEAQVNTQIDARNLNAGKITDGTLGEARLPGEVLKEGATLDTNTLKIPKVGGGTDDVDLSSLAGSGSGTSGVSRSVETVNYSVALNIDQTSWTDLLPRSGQSPSGFVTGISTSGTITVSAGKYLLSFIATVNTDEDRVAPQLRVMVGGIPYYSSSQYYRYNESDTERLRLLVPVELDSSETIRLALKTISSGPANNGEGQFDVQSVRLLIFPLDSTAAASSGGDDVLDIQSTRSYDAGQVADLDGKILLVTGTAQGIDLTFAPTASAYVGFKVVNALHFAERVKLTITDGTNRIEHYLEYPGNEAAVAIGPTVTGATGSSINPNTPTHRSGVVFHDLDITNPSRGTEWAVTVPLIDHWDEWSGRKVIFRTSEDVGTGNQVTLQFSLSEGNEPWFPGAAYHHAKIDIPAGVFFAGGSATSIAWDYDPNNRPEITDDEFIEGNGRMFLDNIRIYTSGTTGSGANERTNKSRIVIGLESAQTGTQRADFSEAFENNGTFILTAGGTTIRLKMSEMIAWSAISAGDPDDQEPYEFVPPGYSADGNLTGLALEVDTLAQRLFPGGNDSAAATVELVLDDPDSVRDRKGEGFDYLVTWENAAVNFVGMDLAWSNPAGKWNSMSASTAEPTTIPGAEVSGTLTYEPVEYEGGGKSKWRLDLDHQVVPDFAPEGSTWFEINKSLDRKSIGFEWDNWRNKNVFITKATTVDDPILTLSPTSTTTKTTTGRSGWYTAPNSYLTVTDPTPGSTGNITQFAYTWPKNSRPQMEAGFQRGNDPIFLARIAGRHTGADKWWEVTFANSQTQDIPAVGSNDTSLPRASDAFEAQAYLEVQWTPAPSGEQNMHFQVATNGTFLSKQPYRWTPVGSGLPLIRYGLGWNEDEDESWRAHWRHLDNANAGTSFTTFWTIANPPTLALTDTFTPERPGFINFIPTWPYARVGIDRITASFLKGGTRTNKVVKNSPEPTTSPAGQPFTVEYTDTGVWRVWQKDGFRDDRDEKRHHPPLIAYMILELANLTGAGSNLIPDSQRRWAMANSFPGTPYKLGYNDGELLLLSQTSRGTGHVGYILEVRVNGDHDEPGELLAKKTYLLGSSVDNATQQAGQEWYFKTGKGFGQNGHQVAMEYTGILGSNVGAEMSASLRIRSAIGSWHTPTGAQKVHLQLFEWWN